MGASRDEFTKYPCTPHLFGSRGTDDDKHLGPDESANLIADSSLIVEEKFDGTNVGIHFIPIAGEELAALIGPSEFASVFDNPITGATDNLMEGLYLRTEANGVVTGRAKHVRPEFVEKVKQSDHWQHRAMVPNVLAPGADLWA